MVLHLRRRLSGLRDHLQPLRERGERLSENIRSTFRRRAQAAISPPALHPEVTKERIKTRVGLLNAIALGLLAGGVINPSLAFSAAVDLRTRLVAACIAAILVMAGQRYLRYIPDTTSPKETDLV
ncbi:MAG: hypothetical protein ACT6R7_16895 [Brevundimonas aurantiaca]|jgi:hypothetical protein|uniref:hypothetical protein n=1 Tax=Brevundimonas aurantiaca TaxID=74316 RepID=UPI004033CAAD